MKQIYNHNAPYGMKPIDNQFWKWKRVNVGWGLMFDLYNPTPENMNIVLTFLRINNWIQTTMSDGTH